MTNDFCKEGMQKTGPEFNNLIGADLIITFFVTTETIRKQNDTGTQK